MLDDLAVIRFEDGEHRIILSVLAEGRRVGIMIDDEDIGAIAAAAALIRSGKLLDA